MKGWETLKHRKICIKLSGAALAGDGTDNFDEMSLSLIAEEILSLAKSGVEVCVMVGGGNLFRGNQAEAWGINRVEADSIGTLGTVMNSLMLRGILKRDTTREVRVMTSIPMPSVAEPYIQLRAINHLKNGYIVIFAGGNGQPFVSSDYPAVQRAIEVGCDALFVAKNGVSGVYDRDPRLDSDARQFETLHYNDVISNDLKVMDQSALLLARDHGLPIHLFDFKERNAIHRILEGESIGTMIHHHETQLLQN
ncbi:MAG: UMP kinase [Exiguobacterium sp.]|nr:UMP kinase [Exiguobacterium sp.]